MARLWKIPGAVAELTVGTMIVLYQLTVAKAFDERYRRLASPTTPSDGDALAPPRVN